MRIFELSKKIGITSKELISLLTEMDIQVKSHMSALTEDDVQAVLKKKNITSKKPIQKKGKAHKKETAELPPPPPKKRFVLRKKRITPPVDTIPVTDTPETDKTPKIELPLEEITTAVEAPKPQVSSPGKKEALPPLAETTDAAKEVKKLDEPEEAQVAPGTLEEASPSTDAKSEKTSLVAPEVEQNKEKSLLNVQPEKKTELKPESKKGPASKLKDKPKRPRQVKWQDFKPIHRREDRKAARRGHGPAVDVAKPRRKVIRIYEGLTVKEFSELIGQKVTSIIAKMMELGKMATINQPITLDEASLIAEAFEIKTEVVSQKTEEELLMQSLPDDPALRVSRPPVITIMGHVDHGKTTLLDAIRETKVTEAEAGGITQHIGAYMVTSGTKQVTFLDTPGHEAFTAMRARGAKVTDIVILVVAADDGVMPQTVEAVNHAKVAGVPIIVVINKIDRPDANPDRIKQALSEYGLIPEDWGGETIFVEASAKEKKGLDQLLEMIILQSEILELKANPKKPMIGIILEAKIERGRGPVATVLVEEGTLKVGCSFVTGIHFGKVRALINDRGQKVKEAGPSTPVEVIGLDGVPLAGDTFISVADERIAKEVANKRSQRHRTAKLSQVSRVTLDDLYQEIKDGTAREALNVIIKADVQGSAEALRASLEKLSTDAVKLHVVHSGVGEVTESDVMLSAASNAIIVGFNIRSETRIRDLAHQEKVSIRPYSIIYDVISDMRSAMEGLLAPTVKEKVLGVVEVRQTFVVPKQGTIAGGYVKAGLAARNCAGIRVIRENSVIFDGKLASLRRFKDDVKEVQTGYECGIGLEGFNDLKIDDLLELYALEEFATKLESA